MGEVDKQIILTKTETRCVRRAQNRKYRIAEGKSVISTLATKPASVGWHCWGSDYATAHKDLKKNERYKTSKLKCSKVSHVTVFVDGYLYYH